jgi:hypothetical protein
MPRNSEFTIFNTYEPAIHITRNYSIQNPIMIKDREEYAYSVSILKKLNSKNKIYC